MRKILIKNGRIFDGDRFIFSDLLVEGESIAKIESGISDSADITFDASGKTVSAGLVDIHTHLRGVSSTRFGIQAEMSCFPFGVTAAVAASAVSGNRELLDSFALKNAVFVCAKIVDDCADLTNAEKMAEVYGDKVVGVKVYYDTAEASVKTAEPLRKICEYAHQKGLRVMVHCTNSPISMAELLDVLGAGDILTHAFHGGVNNAAIDGFESMKTAKSRGVIIDTGCAGNVHTDFEVFGQAIKHGVLPNTISTDVTKLSSFVRGGRYGMTMCMSMARTLGMSEIDIFKAVTSAPANAVGRGSEWGRLEVGMPADVAVFDYTDEAFELTDRAGNRIQSDKGYRCVLTMSDGQIVYKD